MLFFQAFETLGPVKPCPFGAGPGHSEWLSGPQRAVTEHQRDPKDAALVGIAGIRRLAMGFSASPGRRCSHKKAMVDGAGAGDGHTFREAELTVDTLISGLATPSCIDRHHLVQQIVIEQPCRSGGATVTV